MNVLVTDGIMKKSLSVVRSIAPLTTDLGVTSSYRRSMAGVSRYTDRHHHLDQDDPAAYVTEISAVFDRYGYEYVLPVGGWTTSVLSEYRSELSSAVEVVLPNRESMRTAQQKLATYRLGESLDIPVPKTVRATPETDLESVREFGFPVVVKAPTESAPRFIEYADSIAELRTAVRTYRHRYGDDPLVQEYICGEGCGFFALYLDGDCVGCYTHERVREYPPSGGISACAVSRADEQLTEMGTLILDTLKWNGPAMIEFKRDDHGVPNLIEINPKFWGSLDLGIASGFDFPTAILQYLNRGTYPTFEFHPRRYHWPLSGDLQHAVSRPRAAPDVVGDLLSSETSSNLSLSDPLPHVLELTKAALSPFVGE